MRRVCAVLLWAGLVGSAPARPADDAILAEGWELASRKLMQESHDWFEQQVRVRPGAREALFGAVLTKLDLPPLTDEKVAAVRRELEALVNADSADETGLQARYLLGRIRQLYFVGTPPGDDIPEYRQLMADHPGHYLAQLAALKLALQQLYPPEIQPDVAARLARVEALADAITDPGLRCDFHLMLGDAYLFFGDQRAPALRHYGAAEQLGIRDNVIRATVLVQIGELARLEGDAARARAAYRRFLQEFRRDLRVTEVRRRLAGLEGGEHEP